MNFEIKYYKLMYEYELMSGRIEKSLVETHLSSLFIYMVTSGFRLNNIQLLCK